VLPEIGLTDLHRLVNKTTIHERRGRPIPLPTQGLQAPQFKRKNMADSTSLVITLHGDDDVAIARGAIAAGTVLHELDGLLVANDIPAAHKVALRALQAGDPVRRYGQIIGFATQPIEPGAHVHTHNVSMGDFARDYAYGTNVKAVSPAQNALTFQGFRRADGRVATRNYIGVVSTVNCSATVTKLVTQHFSAPGALDAWPNVDGIVPVTHSFGCCIDHNGEGIQQLRRTIGGYVRHPNFAGVLVIGLGCEANQMGAMFVAEGVETGEMTVPLVIQEQGGTQKTVDAAIAAIEKMLPVANNAVREPLPVSHLNIALQCGGSDGYSGITANPALGAAVDLLVQHGGTAILSETPEIYGAEHLLTRRAVTPEVGQKIVERIHWWENYAEQSDAGQQGRRLDHDPRKIIGRRRQERLDAAGGRLSLRRAGDRQRTGVHGRARLRPDGCNRTDRERREPCAVHHRTRFMLRRQACAVDQARHQHEDVHAHGR
jgi:altronate hydrolase